MSEVIEFFLYIIGYEGLPYNPTFPQVLLFKIQVGIGLTLVTAVFGVIRSVVVELLRMRNL